MIVGVSGDGSFSIQPDVLVVSHSFKEVSKATNSTHPLIPNFWIDTQQDLCSLCSFTSGGNPLGHQAPGIDESLAHSQEPCMTVLVLSYIFCASSSEIESLHRPMDHFYSSEHFLIEKDICSSAPNTLTTPQAEIRQSGAIKEGFLKKKGGTFGNWYAIMELLTFTGAHGAHQLPSQSFWLPYIRKMRYFALFSTPGRLDYFDHRGSTMTQVLGRNHVPQITVDGTITCTKTTLPLFVWNLCSENFAPQTGTIELGSISKVYSEKNVLLQAISWWVQRKTLPRVRIQRFGVILRTLGVLLFKLMYKQPNRLCFKYSYNDPFYSYNDRTTHKPTFFRVHQRYIPCELLAPKTQTNGSLLSR